MLIRFNLSALTFVVFILALIGMPFSATAQELLVANYGDGTIQRFSRSTGESLGLFATVPSGKAYNLAADAIGNIYVSDNQSVYKYAPSGALLTQYATGPGAVGLACDQSGNLYVGDYEAYSTNIHRFTPDGTDLGQFGPAMSRIQEITFDTSGYMYMVSFGENVIRKVSPDGTDLGVVISGLANPTCLAFDSSGDMFVGNWNNIPGHSSYITKYSSSGTFLSTFASSSLYAITDIVFDSEGDLYASNNDSNNIVKYASNGTQLETFTSSKLNMPNNMLFIGNITPEPNSIVLILACLIGATGLRRGKSQRMCLSNEEASCP